MSAEEANALAKKYMAEGSARFAKRDFDGAYESLLKAWEVKKHVAIATNLVETEIKLGRYVDAAERVRAAITEFSLERKEDAETLYQRMDECRPHVVALHISVNVADANVRVDRRLVGRSPLVIDVFVTPGSGTVSAELEGYQPATTPIGPNVAGDKKEIQLTLVPLQATAPATTASVVATAPAEQPSGNAARTVVLVSGAVLTAAAATVGIVYAVKRGDLYDSAESLKTKIGVGACTPGSEVDVDQCRSLKDAWAKYDRAGNIMTGAFVGAGVFGVATVATYFLWPSKKAQSSAQARTTVAPWSLGDGAGVQVLGTF